MKTLLNNTLAFALALGLFGCTTSGSSHDTAATQKPERGPDGTIAYNVLVESSEPGVRIEANGDYVGKTPVTLKIFGDKDGTFHNFGNYHYTIKAYPLRAGQDIQVKDFRTGKWFTPEDMIPKRLYFDFGSATEPKGPETR